MKLWVGYGSEHSMNLVMIGRFQEAKDAAAAKRLIDQLTALVQDENAAGRLHFGEPGKRFSDEATKALWALNCYSIGPGELEQFAYDVHVEHKGNVLELKTDESDVSAFLKVLIDHKGRVEVFSAHHHETGTTAPAET